MKNSGLFLFLVVIVAQIFCNEAQTEQGIIITPRDTTITPANAYTNLFFDSVRLEQFISREITEDSIANYLRSFYNARNFSFAWFDEQGLTIQAQGFWNAHNQVINQDSDSSIYNRRLHQLVDTLLSDSSYVLSKNALEEAEMRFTKHFFTYIRFAYSGKVDPEKVQWHIPRQKLKPVALLDSFLNNEGGNWRELSPTYYKLQQQLFRFKSSEQAGGWQAIRIPSKSVSPGSSNAIVGAIKKRLNATELYAGDDTSYIYNEALIEAVKNAEKSFGLPADGIIDAALIKELNVPVGERIKQLVVNLERIKWLPENPDNYLLANIPEYKLHVFENGKDTLTMKIVVGKAANRTVVFSDELKYIVFSPYWNIPRSIVRNEIYPAMKRSSSYLRRNNMEVTGYSGGLPSVRQKPGSGNALGQVKFIFPNNYNIYFHDTPSRGLFDRQNRAFSHGCIRLHQPFELAVYLLRNNSEWTNEKIKAAMNGTTEKWVSLNKAVPVFITYFTAWVDESGLLHFANDIYGHDKRMEKHLFQ